VCERERERQRQRETERDRETEKDRETAVLVVEEKNMSVFRHRGTEEEAISKSLMPL
jgi:hypothetical protein